MSTETWWHGGPKITGSRVLPPAVTGTCRSGPDGEHQHVVFVTPVRSLIPARCTGFVGGRRWVGVDDAVGSYVDSDGTVEVQKETKG
jgi:hypothetical protein